MRTYLAVMGLVVGSLFAQTQTTSHTDLPASAQQALNSIDSEKIRATVKYLADDALEGRGADLKGKVLLILVNEPPSDDPNFFKGKALTYYGRWTYKYEEAARRGAIGAILIHKTEMASYGWDVVRNSWGGESSFLQEEKDPKLKSEGWIQLAVAQKLAQAAGKDLDSMMNVATSRDFKPVELPITVKETVVSHVRPFSSRNVVGKVTGSDSSLKSQAVFYTAHYDHLGIHPDEPGDHIYNGAADNATGCGILLELARAFVDNKKKPKLSIFFAAVTAEEQGLLGSRYLGEHPPVPARKISLDLNYDDIQPYGEPQQLVVTGAERTSIYSLVEKEAKEFEMSIQPDTTSCCGSRSEEHTSELQSQSNLVCRLLLEKKKQSTH